MNDEINDLRRFEPLWDSWYIKETIGEGGYGKVFRIERKEFDNTYVAALKHIRVPKTQSEVKSVMADSMSLESAEKYFEGCVGDIVKEIVLMSKLKGNSHIVSYEDHKVVKTEGKIEWDLFIRMELLTSLIDYIAKNNITKRDIIQLGIDICKALETCQKYNIIHRDIKPENIFVSETGQFKLGDFGIARQVEKTVAGLSKKGTFTYIAPEAYKGEPYGSSVDIYSLGIVMYRLLNNNRVPFMPPYPMEISHLDKETALAKRMSGLPIPPPCNSTGRLTEIVLKACSYAPKDRYHSPGVMRADLEAILYDSAEAKVIYPDGDVADINSIKYISSKSGGVSGFDTAKTELMGDGTTELMADNYAPASSKSKVKKGILACAGVLCVGAIAAAVAVSHNSKSVADTQIGTEATELNADASTEISTEEMPEISTYSAETNIAAGQCFGELLSTESNGYRYLYYDIDKDGVDELLIDSLQYDTKYLNYRVYKYAVEADSTNFLGAIGCGYSNVNAVAIYGYDGNGIVAHGYDASDSNSVVTILFEATDRELNSTELLRKTTSQSGKTEYCYKGKVISENEYNTRLKELTALKQDYEQVETSTVATTVEPTTVQTTAQPATQATQPVKQTKVETKKTTQAPTQKTQPVTQAPVQKTQPVTQAAQPVTQAPVQQTQPTEQGNTSSGEGSNNDLPPIVMGFD